MTALVSSQPALVLNDSSEQRQASNGILLNTRSLSAPLNSFSRQSPTPSSALASSSSSISHASDLQSRSNSSNSGDAATARKIRFAPLPDPRRDDFPAVFDQDDSDSDSPGQLPRHQSAPPDYGPAPPSPAPSSHSLQEFDQHSDSGKQKSKKWGQKLLRPLFQPLKPSSSSKSVEENMLRTSPRDAPKSSGSGLANGDVAVEYKGGASLGRRMSATGFTTSKEAERSHAFRDGAPLTHVLSESGGSTGIKGRKDGQRMLNGRVYGRRASSADRERAESKRRQMSMEPEFVEWGYGGMGSVNNDHARGRSGSAGLDWGKVQSRGKTFGEVSDDDGEGDDGSGMGWVRRRREQREREKREREEREKKKQTQSDVPEIEVHPPESKVAAVAAEKDVSCDTEPLPKDEERHIYRAVSVPAPQHHLSRHHSHHRGGETSGTNTPTSALSASRSNSAGSAAPRNEPLLNPLPTPEMTSSGSSSSISSLASKTSSESLQEDEDDGTERESDDEDAQGAESRITSKSAGVEKISRHKE